MIVVAYFVLFLSFINLIRMAIFLIASDYFDIVNMSKDSSGNQYFSENYRPLVSILVPAHNEELTLERNLKSILNSSYRNFEIIVIIDSSTDNSLKIARRIQRNNKAKNIKVIERKVRGKAKALNAGIKYIRGSLFMCLDADSYLTKESLKIAVETFREKRIGSLSSNVKIVPDKGVLNIIQRIEYLVCYQMKKAETKFQIQYIVGGIGSMYRTRNLKRLNLYETDTITEDIDLSMKFIEVYKRNNMISYNPAFVVFTEGVTNIHDLLRQRFRWKYGRYQVFLKRKKLFFRAKNSKSFILSWIYLPYALFSELTYALEPLTIVFIFFLIFKYQSFTMVIGAFITFCFYTVIQIMGATQGYEKKERLKLIIFTPMVYILMYVLSFAEYYATIKGFMKLPNAIRNYKTGENNNCEWNHVSRKGIKITE